MLSCFVSLSVLFFSFFFNDTATTEIYTLSLHALFRSTADIPLAAEVIARGSHALNPRGEFYTRDTIQERLTMRNFMDGLRGSGVDTGGPPALSQGDRQAFANQLDRFLAKLAAHAANSG